MVEKLKGIAAAAGALEGSPSALPDAADMQPDYRDKLRLSVGEREFGATRAERKSADRGVDEIEGVAAGRTVARK